MSRKKPDWEALRTKHRKTGPVTISLNTLVPEKYRVVDLETGDVWGWDGTTWRAPDDTDIKSMTDMLLKNR